MNCNCGTVHSENHHIDNAPLVGQKVPDLKLEAFHNETIKDVSLRGLHGKWFVLFFYPADFTFVCPTELEELADLYPEFQKINTEIVSVSTDTVYVHKAWHDQSLAIKKVKFPMLADPAGKLCRALGVHLHDEGVSLRGTFIIDPHGKIVAMEVNDNSIGRSARELLRKLQAAQFVSKNKGQVCPASWTPGDETLKPGLGLVGKI